MENEESGGVDSRGVLPVSSARNLQHSVKFYRKPAWIAVVCVVVLVITILGAFLYRGQDQYRLAERHTLVPDKISQSASIIVMLPEDAAFSNFDPALSLTFSPEIKGKWETPSPAQKNTYRFLPAQKLSVGAYHLVTLDTPELKMEKMFSVDNDPTVLAVFPKQETEVNEYSSVTIMFSRPMVALSTLGDNADVTPSVEINPKTEGRFKWITTRTLQFIPKVRLFRSSAYTVNIKDGMISFDGVKVPAFSHTFTTRTLKYQTPDRNQEGAFSLQHDQPLRISFDQPFDLEKTRSSITLSSSNTNLPQSFVVAYGTRIVSDEKTGKTRTLTDQSVLDIFPEKDTHGRSYLWNFGETYRVIISGAVPLEGNVKLAVPLNKSFSITPIIENVTAQSPRSNLVTPDIFDPTGTLTFHISEPVDLSASDIVGKGIAKIVYGQTCEEPPAGREVYIDPQNCKKTDDRKSIIVSFDAQMFGMKETSFVTINKLVNSDGVILNMSPLAQRFTTFPRFEIVRTTPWNEAKDGSLTQLRICSTVPLATPSDEDFYKKIRSNMMIGLWNWDRSFLVTPSAYPQEDGCPVGAFQTTIRYGLVPTFSYELALDLNDHFGRQLTKTIRFTTKDADPLVKGFSHLQPTVVMTPPDRTVLTYGLDFMNEVDMTICKVTAETMLRYRAFPVDIQSTPAMLDCIERKTSHLTLPQSYATRKYLQVNLRDYYTSPIGNYVVVLSNPNYRRVSRLWESGVQSLVLHERLFEKTYVTVTTLAVGSKQVERGDNYYTPITDREVRDSFMKDKWPTNLYWVNNFRNLSAVYGAVVTPYVKRNETIARLPS
ncbi:MAG: Ig-like domain-containing protein, partial [Patescibacteria group bacterium]